VKLPSVEGHKKFLRSVLDKADVDVQFVKGLDVPYAARDPRTSRACLYLREPILTDLLEVTLWDWDAHHEGSHLFPELAFTYEAVGQCKTNLEATIVNILADNICEKARHGIWRGRDRILYDGRRTFSEQHPDVLLRRETPGVSALYGVDYQDRQKWQGNYPVLEMLKGADKYLPALNALDIFKRLEDITERQSADEFMVLTREIAKILGDDGSGSQGQGQGQGKGKSQKGKGQGEKQKGKGGNQGGESDEADGEDGESSGSGGEGEGEEEGKGSDSPTPESGDDGDSGGSQGAGNTEDSGDQSGNSGQSQENEGSSDNDDTNAVSSGNTEGSGNTKDLSRVDIADNAREMHTRVVTEESLNTDQWSSQYNPVGKHEIATLKGQRGGRVELINQHLSGNTVSRQVQRYLKIMSKDSYEYGLVKGRIHGKNVHRIYTGSESPRIFKEKRVHRLKTNTAVEIMLDCSGSMSTHKYTVGAACCMAISKTLWELRIQHEILGFTEDYGTLITYPFKLFSERCSLDTLCKRFASSIIQGYNADGESILIGANRLAERKEDNKLMIVLSDGRPATSGHSGDGKWYLKTVVKSIEESQINIIGIGIQDTSVRQFYTHWRVVDKVEDLNKELFELLKDSLT